MEPNAITGEIIRAAMKVHSALGPGLLESVYRLCLCHELKKRGLSVLTEQRIQIVYDGIIMPAGLRLDILVEDKIVVEVKAVQKWNELYESQLLSYLKLSKLKLGLLINFNVRHLRNGIKRMIR
jgi:GxxExxY protein